MTEKFHREERKNAKDFREKVLLLDIA